MFGSQLAKLGVFDRNNSDFDIVGLELLPDDRLHAGNCQFNSVLLGEVPACFFHFFLEIVDGVLLLDAGCDSLVAVVVAGRVDLVEGGTFFCVDAGHDGFNSEHSLHGFLGGNLVVVGQSRSKVINGDVVTHFAFVVGGFHLKSCEDIFAVG